MDSLFEQFVGTIIRHKKLSIILCSSFVIIIICLAVANGIKIASKKAESEHYNAEGSVTITNLDQYQKNKPPQEWIDYLNKDLYKTLNYNSEQTITESITDAAIRDKSYSEEYNSKTQTYTVKYLVDIPSRQQSYFVNYKWSPDSHSSLTPAPSTYCPTPKQLVYGEFDCHDYYIYQTDDNKMVYKNYVDRFIVYITPFSASLDNKVSFTAKRKFKNDEPYIEVVFTVCDAGNYVEDAKTILKRRAEEHNLDISDFRVDFNITKCDYYDYSNM